MNVSRRALIGSGAAFALAGCARTSPLGLTALPARPRLAPLHADTGHLMKVTVCLRPFRPAGPRLEAERYGDKTVVHNYGHGGSGWSLSWGCAEDAVALARSGGAIEFAVIGAGVMGLTTALRLVETGAKVTIYADQFPSETRSARATGVWSPSSRIGLAGQVDEGFSQRWESWARRSYAIHRSMVGVIGDPVEFIPGYDVADPDRAPGPRASRPFLHLGRTVRDMEPRWSRLGEEATPFQGKRTSSGLSMVFNVASYADRLTRLFLLRGGKMVRRSFPDRSAVLALSEPVIVNCMGYGAKSIWGDASLVPVRGQISWLVPQPDARYSVFYDDVFAVSRRDGVVLQYTGPNDDYGYGIDQETVDSAETERVLETMQRLYRSAQIAAHQHFPTRAAAANLASAP